MSKDLDATTEALARKLKGLPKDDVVRILDQLARRFQVVDLLGKSPVAPPGPTTSGRRGKVKQAFSGTYYRGPDKIWRYAATGEPVPGAGEDRLGMYAPELTAERLLDSVGLSEFIGVALSSVRTYLARPDKHDPPPPLLRIPPNIPVWSRPVIAHWRAGQRRARTDPELGVEGVPAFALDEERRLTAHGGNYYRDTDGVWRYMINDRAVPHAIEDQLGMWAPELSAGRLLAIPDVAEILEVKPSAVRAYLSRQVAGMPAPVARFGDAPVWPRPVILAWHNQRPRRGQGRRMVAASADSS
jgi:hypothetical protein